VLIKILGNVEKQDSSKKEGTMAPTKTIKSEDVSIVSAVQTLSSIADLELSSALHDPLIISAPPREAPIMVRTVRWLHQKNAERMQEIMREKLRVVLNYLKHFYSSEKERFARKESMEGIRTIMMVVDEASENLDRYTKLFLGTQGHSIKETKEFLDLCQFYEAKIVPIAVHRKVATWIGALPIEEILSKAQAQKSEWFRQVEFAPLSVELEDIQRDIDYELLLIRRADGSRFFTPKFIRSMRLACDIEQAVDWEGRKQLENEIDALKRMQIATEVNYLIENSYPVLDTFFHAAHRASEHSLVLDLYSPCIALMIAALQAIHRSEAPRAKGIDEYFNDFRALFSAFVNSQDFKRLSTYPQTNEYSWEYVLVKLTETLASNIVDGAPMSLELVNNVKGLLNQGMPSAVSELGAPDGSLSNDLNLKFAALRHLIGTRGNTTLAKLLGELEDLPSLVFEPLVSEALPIHLFDLSWRGDLIPIVRLPSPTRQEKINSAVPSEVFQMALRRHGRQSGRFLVINLQDRTGWKAGARCQAIEELQGSNGVNRPVSVFSLCSDGDFYNQEGRYDSQSSAQQFKEDLLEHIVDPDQGTLFPKLPEMKIDGEARDLIDRLHSTLYSGRNVLSKGQRIEFIDLVYVILMLRVIEETHPEIVFVSCKDGLDISLPAIANLFIFLKLFNRRTTSEEESDWLASMLLGLPLVERDRLLFTERYRRMTSFARFLEEELQEEKQAVEPAKTDCIIRFLPQEIAFSALLTAVGHQPTYFDRKYSI
jgi:hypothetical protein